VRHIIRWIFVLTAVCVVMACSSDDEKKAAHLEKGKAYFEKGEYKSAEIELKNAIQIDPQYVDAYIMLAETSLKLGNPQIAFSAYAAAAKIDPDNTDAQLKLATFYLLNKKLEEARGKIDVVLGKAPNNIEALYLLGNLLGKQFSLVT